MKSANQATFKAAILGSAALLWSPTAHAQSAASPAPTTAAEDGEILVTARRQSERLSDVPASIAAFSSETLELAGARTGGDVVALTSGVSIAVGAVEASDVQVNIRGLNGSREAENSVAIVVDGIQRSSKAALVQNQGILQQVEVLKGPQGALYGRNATAGAFVITTRKPGDHLEGEFKASYGNNASYLVSGVVSAPVSDNLGVQLGGDWSKTDGFYRNIFLPSADNRQLYPGNSTDASSVDSKRDWNVYGRAVWTPDEVTEFDAKVRYGEYRGNALNFNAVLQLPGFAALTGNPLFNIDNNDHRFVFAPNIESLNKLRTLELSLLGTRDLGFANLKGYIAYSNFKNFLAADGASGTFNFFSGSSRCAATSAALTGFPVQAPFAVGALPPPYSPTTCDGIGFERHDNKDISAELRLISPSGQPLQWQAGLYYMNIKRRDCVATEADLGQGFVAECYTTDPRAPTEALRDDSSNVDVYAAFGSVGYRFENSLNLQAALRYDREIRHSTNNVPVNARTHYVGNPATGFPNGTDSVPANYYLNPGLDPAYNPSGRLLPLSATFEQVQPKLTVDYKLTPDTTVYANWGIGFKSGGFNGGGTKAIVDGLFNRVFNSEITVSDVYKKETNSAYEAGIKGLLFDRKLTFSLAGYYSNVKNLQVFEFFVGTFGSLRVVENIDKVRIYGIEGDISLRATDWLTLFTSANYTNSRIKKNTTRPYTVGNEVPLTPKYTVNAGGQLKLPVADHVLVLGRVEARVTGPTWFSAVQDNDVPSYFGTANFRKSRRDAFTTVDARLGVEHDRLTVSAYASNLFDVKYFKDSAVTPEFGGNFISPGDRRSYGIELNFKF
ncbi:TonB-dependent receptor [Sphingopyxis granuli]|uniref:TonB-dependent receptor n=1 Tax=Sphingopyxis granuli TaxID=267128 RepID=UPI001BB0BAA7|nr:TonB-dependent receptor [Sphingopyxis granuli]QUM71018.1 TonB-dependent receptor [Sphingopyxis granuli]